MLPQKIAPGKRMARQLTVNTRSSCVYAMSLPMLNTIWTRPLFEPLQAALLPSWHFYVVPAPFRPAMVFVNDSQADRALVAAFQQNALQRVNVGDEAEVLFKAIPGRVFKAKVGLVYDAIPAGQLQTTGTLVAAPELEGAMPGNRALVRLDLVDDISGYHVPLGSTGEAAIYTEHFHELSLLRKILLRMRSWQNYVFPESL